MKMRNLVWCLVLCLLVFPLAAAAEETGSLTIVEVDSPVRLYCVAAPDAVPAGDFAEAAVTELSDAENAVENARILYDYALTRQLPGQEAAPDAEGSVRYEGLEMGYYLICSTDGEFSPFLVTIPTQINGELIYHVTADPKDDPQPTQPTQPSEPEETTPPTEPSEPGTPDIPQTGNSVWPKYLLLALGALLTVAGLADLILGRERQL